VDTYNISYSYEILACTARAGTVGGQPVVISGISGYSTSYRLSSLQENSQVNANLTAINGVGNSAWASVESTTKTAGNFTPFGFKEIHKDYNESWFYSIKS